MKEMIIYQCPGCGGPLKFDPEKQRYRCEFCLSEFTQEQLEEGEAQRPKDEPASEERSVPLLYTCPSCGAELVTDETTAATFCYYCHNPVILSGRLAGEYHPDYVIPFSVDRKAAEGIFEQWIRKKRFVPKAFYSKEQIEKLSGVYFPYLLYSCQAEGEMEANATRIRVWTSGNTRYTETSTYQVSRQGSMAVNFVPRNGLKKANHELAEGVLPYKTEQIKPFSMPYLSGFLAERRDIEEKELEGEVKDEVRRFAEKSIKATISSYDTVKVQNSRIRLQNEKWEYVLFPVWALTYRSRIKGKTYYFVINGQTGKVCGKLPADKGKLSVLFAAVLVLVFSGLLLMGYLI